jgi:hypothetical protein
VTPVFTLIPAKPWHCGAMVRRLRVEHMAAIAKLGLDPHKQLVEDFDQSLFRKALLIDGKLEGLGGIIGTALSGEGYVWLVLSDKAACFPRMLVREARRQLDLVMQTKRMLLTTILDDDEAALRFAIFLGFVPTSERTEPAASRAGRRVLARRVSSPHEVRVAIGRGSAVVMAYREMETA